MGNTLQPQQAISHYRVVSRLGAGGMGEVYLAHDQTLERNVALKVLPPEVVGDGQRLDRFVLEARSASSLSHPNIVTIYEIGQDRVHDSPVHYIAMELVDGDTLGDKIHRDKTDLRTLLGYLAQAAEGLTKAHAAGIVHRDLKPGNIMVTKDGFTKILDFGLAKLTEPQAAGAGETQLRTELTGAGVVMGTAGYMSPEQILARPVDPRSDIFSFGCILYEAATGQRPFAADTGIETMHKVLNEKPRPVDELNQNVPSDLRRLIRRCLAKNPDERYQSIKDVAIELREMVADFESLPVGPVSSSATAAAIAPPPRRMRPLVVASIGVGVVAVLAVAVLVGVLVSRRGGGPVTAGDEPFQAMRMTALLSGMNVVEAALSADGRFLGYVERDGARYSLHVRQVSTGSDVEAIAPQEVPLRGLAFSPDGDYLYYLGRDSDAPNYSTLFTVPSLGGTPRRRVTDVDTAVTFSPDGKKLCFLRGVTKTSQTSVVVADVASGAERVLATTVDPDRLPTTIWPRWSPDGRKIAAVVARNTGGIQSRPVVFDAETGRMEPIGSWTCIQVNSLVWQSPTRLAVAALDDLNGSLQLWQLTYPDGTARRITNDQNNYTFLSGSADATSLACLRVSQSFTGWMVPVAGNGEPRQLPLGMQNPLSIAAATDGTIVFAVSSADRSGLWASRPDGTARRPLSPDTLAVFQHTILPDNAGTVFQGFGKDRIPHIWRASLDGTDVLQLTQGTGEYLNAVSADGRRVLFQRADISTDVWSIPLPGGGEPVKAVAGRSADYSPDGRLMRVARDQTVGGRTVFVHAIVPSDGGEAIASFRPETRMRVVVWGGDSASLLYVVTDNGVDTVMRWPVTGGAAAPVFRFAEGRIDAVTALRDRSVVFVATVGETRNLWRWSPAATKAQPLTHFPIGVVATHTRSFDDKTIYFSQGVTTREVVLIRGVR